jgi:hypothetical protein
LIQLEQDFTGSSHFEELSFPVGVTPQACHGVYVCRHQPKPLCGRASPRDQKVPWLSLIARVLQASVHNNASHRRVRPVGSGFEFFGESCGPLFPSEMTQLAELDGKREGLRLPRLSKDRSTLVGWKLRQDRESSG